MNSPSAYSAIPTVAPGARLEAVTPTDSNIFFGFHDVSPFSADGSQLLVHRIPSGWDAMAKQSPAGIITDYPQQYQQWAATTDYCKTPKKQKAKRGPAFYAKKKK